MSIRELRNVQAPPALPRVPSKARHCDQSRSPDSALLVGIN
jgi:hypothetical protein